MLQDIFKVSSGFQSSVNIAYDFNDRSKISCFIPTSTAISIIESIIENTETGNNEKAKILTGAYGRGKSHIVLVALSILYNKEKKLFKDLLKKIRNLDKDVAQRIENYIDSPKRMMPVIVTGSSGSLSQAFLKALQQALKTYELDDIMPETYYTAAVEVIERWKNEYPDTYSRFQKKITNKKTFESKLSTGDENTYRKFVEIYPELTSGAEFNPFVNADVVEIYDNINKELKSKGFSGIYVVYDEFGKYLETSISRTSESDMKLLQDFAEKCNRENDQQMHLMLICHKDIENYIDDGLSQDKVDGWRGISGRFEHLVLRNNFHQMYEIISNTINRNSALWEQYKNKYKAQFEELLSVAKKRNYLSGKDQLVVYDCYPLHPTTTFLLPRLSEKIAQNERTLFTFLTANQKNTLREYIENSEDDFSIMTPDYLYNYFEQELRKELKSSELHKAYYLAAKLLNKTETDLESDIIKTIAIIYCVSQFERIAPTFETICDIYSVKYDVKTISDTINDLISKKYIVYKKSSNNFLCLKETSGIDIDSELANEVAKLSDSLDVQAALNKAVGNSYLYPVRHNEEKCLTRYFDFKFVMLSNLIQGKLPEIRNGACGAVLGVIFHDSNEFGEFDKNYIDSVKEGNTVVIIPNEFDSIENVVYRYLAARELMASCSLEDAVLRSEYELIADDLENVIFGFAATYTKPELHRATYYYNAENVEVTRKSALTELLSNICDTVYPHTPVINNESINKDNLPGVAVTSRTKLCTAILESSDGAIQENLGLTGTGQDVSFMRSTLIKTGILKNNSDDMLVYDDSSCEESVSYMLSEIKGFFLSTATSGERALSDLYEILTGRNNGIGMKKGPIPVYMAVALRSMKDELVFKSDGYEVKISADALNSINEKPSEYSVLMIDWDDEKRAYLNALEEGFSEHVILNEKSYNIFTYIVNAIDRWHLSLPKCSREYTKKYSDGKTVPAKHKQFYSLLRTSKVNAHDFIMNKVPEVFGDRNPSHQTAESLLKCKKELDGAKTELLKKVILVTKTVFDGTNTDSLQAVITSWVNRLKESTRQHMFQGNENQVLRLMDTVSNDEQNFAERLGKAVTGLRIDDWSYSIYETYESALADFKVTVEAYDSDDDNLDNNKGKQFSITSIDENGRESVYSFERTEYSRYAQLLYRDITGALSDIGQSVTEGEKRQVLFDILKSLC